MPGLTAPYLHIQNALTSQDLNYLRDACKRHLMSEGMPCYVLIDDLEAPTYKKIVSVLEQNIGAKLFYLNDFYMYTDSTFKTNWHMDTELFAFDRAINAWILLSPDAVEDPLGFIDCVNDLPERSFHSVRIEEGRCIFGDYCTGAATERPLAEVEAERIHTPRIQLGDILVLNPKRFHKTNVDTPKHAMAFKFILEGPNGFLSDNQVDPYLWPEVGVFNKLVAPARTWDDVIAGIRRALQTPAGRESLASGFYPKQFGLYKRMVAML